MIIWMHRLLPLFTNYHSINMSKRGLKSLHSSLILAHRIPKQSSQMRYIHSVEIRLPFCFFRGFWELFLYHHFMDQYSRVHCQEHIDVLNSLGADLIVHPVYVTLLQEFDLCLFMSCFQKQKTYNIACWFRGSYEDYFT